MTFEPKKSDIYLKQKGIKEFRCIISTKNKFCQAEPCKYSNK